MTKKPDLTLELDGYKSGAHVQRVRNVNEAYGNLRYLVNFEPRAWRHIDVRGQHTMEWRGTFITEYLKPNERVLFDPVRDCNHFFHFFESLWILAGRNDVEYLTTFNSRMKEFSDNGLNFHGAYGYRLRVQQSIDQLHQVIHLLRKDPNTRRAVLQIWDAALDLGMRSKDIPCNDMLFFKARDGKLNMTICCRSNDAIWGAYGANAVHFSVLQEFIAAATGNEVGTMTQVSDSFHVYSKREDFVKMESGNDHEDPYSNTEVIAPFEILPLSTEKSVDYTEWLIQLDYFMRNKLGEYRGEVDMFFSDVATPLLNAWKAYKDESLIPIKNERIQRAKYILEKCQAFDWRRACTEWLDRRKEA